jgi:hypothetical protein
MIAVVKHRVSPLQHILALSLEFSRDMQQIFAFFLVW